ncbi:LytR/AlgR family response regulator transcription factor [Flavivirga spongiicola]|uniref:DNA-binding response regulator n=1 Tax=Flavivirga spongiicola TaxID=421621 RepID=A0ABU7XY91_9FLAO|nr:response regulator [Flavivirga sp. MEBiC05379]MDO5980753.1 response regulator [Flavivirga sp. MEBiC05379]
MRSNNLKVMKCVVVDTCPKVIDTLKSYLNRIEHVKLVASFINPIDAVTFLNKNKIDLAFLDAKLFCSNWIEITKKIEHLPQFIFTADDAKFRLEAFKLNATDYLIKPMVFNDLLKGIFKVKNRDKQLSSSTVNIVSAGTKETKKDRGGLLIKTEYETIKLDISEIKYIQTVKCVTKIFINNYSAPIITTLELDKILVNLPDYFRQIHKSFIINTCLINKVLKRKVVIDDMHIPIGEIYADRVMTDLAY